MEKRIPFKVSLTEHDGTPVKGLAEALRVYSGRVFDNTNNILLGVMKSFDDTNVIMDLYDEYKDDFKDPVIAITYTATIGEEVITVKRIVGVYIEDRKIET